MAGPIPCLGYPTRTDAILALRAEGLDTRAIAARIGIEVKTVTSLEASRRRTRRAGDPRTSALPAIEVNANVRRVPVEAETMIKLRQHAARRGVSAEFLANQLLQVLVDDNLVDATLDDMEMLS